MISWPTFEKDVSIEPQPFAAYPGIKYDLSIKYKIEKQKT